MNFRIANAHPDQMECVRELWREYWRAAGFSPGFQGFAAEVEGLPGAYAEPAGRLLLARRGDEIAGTLALRPLTQTACEAKRLFVRPAFRGAGLARTLIERLIEEARAIGYADMFCDTMPEMTRARLMYEEFGFVETVAYSRKPTPGAIYFRLVL